MESWVGISKNFFSDNIIPSIIAIFVAACILVILTWDSKRIVKFYLSLWIVCFVVIMSVALMASEMKYGLPLIIVALITFCVFPFIFRWKPQVIGMSNLVRDTPITKIITMLQSMDQNNSIEDLHHIATTISAEHKSVRRILTHAARRHVAHLLSDREEVALGIKQYTELLKLGVFDQEVKDITIINVIPPDEWGNKKGGILDEVQEEAWKYLDLQIETKKDRKKKNPLRIRRFLAISKENKDNLIKEQKDLWEAFIEAHNNGHIDLFWFPPEVLRDSERQYFEDATIFYCSNFNGWKLASTVLRAERTNDVSGNSSNYEYLFKTHIRADTKFLQNEYTGYLTKIFEIGEKNPLCTVLNQMPEDFKRHIGFIID